MAGTDRPTVIRARTTHRLFIDSSLHGEQRLTRALALATFLPAAAREDVEIFEVPVRLCFELCGRTEQQEGHEEEAGFFFVPSCLRGCSATTTASYLDADQKSYCTPNLKRRPSRICVGRSQFAPYVVFRRTTPLSLNTLYRSAIRSRFFEPPRFTFFVRRRSS